MYSGASAYWALDFPGFVCVLVFQLPIIFLRRASRFRQALTPFCFADRWGLRGGVVVWSRPQEEHRMVLY